MASPLDSTLEDFIARTVLPHRAKVTQGYYEAGDEDGNREFSNGEIIDIRRVLCPLVDLTFTRRGTLTESKATVSTRTQDVRFHVVTREEALGLNEPLEFRSVKQLADNWPNMVRITEDLRASPGDATTRKEAIASKGDELRLIRLVFDDPDHPDGVQLELKNLRSQRLVRIPRDRIASFVEIPDPRSYTLQELVDMARVPRYLRIGVSGSATDRVRIRGLSPDHRDILKMSKPSGLVEIARVLVDDSTGTEYHGAPLLVPLDCDIRLAPREDSYHPLPFETLHLSRLDGRHEAKIPSVARVVDWSEESTILRNHVTRPGDQLAIFAMTSSDKILAHGQGRFFVIPVGHRGCFTRTRTTSWIGLASKLDLKSLETSSFPFAVRYSDVSGYRNTADENLPKDRDLTFDRYVKAERSVVVSKLFGDVIGCGFHLPLRTKITVRLEKRWKISTDPPGMSPLDSCSEEIPGTLYNEMMKSADYEWVQADTKPPPRPPRTCSSSVRPGAPAPVKRTVRKLRKPPIPKDDKSDDDEHDYVYIDLERDSLKNSKSEGKDDLSAGIIEIPNNGNISHFSTDQMVAFLGEHHVSSAAVTAFKKARYDGRTFARMSDKKLQELGLSVPVIQFFRDRSKIQLVLHQL